MTEFRTTKIFASVDAVFQGILLLGYLGVLVWNDIHKNVAEKILAEYGVWTMYAGLASALTGLVLDVFLLYFIVWKVKIAVYLWNYLCFILALQTWMAHLAVIYIGNGNPVVFPNASLGIWAFMLLYLRITLVIIVRSDYLRMLQAERRHSKKAANKPYSETLELQVDCPSSPSTVSVSATPTYRMLNAPSTTTPSPPPCQLTPRMLDFNEDDVEPRLVHYDKSSTTLCTVLSPQANIDHYIAQNKPIIHANDEKGDLEELKTVM